MHHSASTSAFLPACPACTHGIGQAYSVSLGHGQRTVRYRCDSCAHAWQETSSDAEAMFTGSALRIETVGVRIPKH